MCAYACGDRYEGAWAAGVRCGKGACAYANGDAYQGVSRLGFWASQCSPAWRVHHVAAKVHTIDQTVLAQNPGAGCSLSGCAQLAAGSLLHSLRFRPLPQPAQGSTHQCLHGHSSDQV